MRDDYSGCPICKDDQMAYKAKWKINSLNKPFWNEVLVGKKIKKISFNRDGIKYILLDSGEKIFTDKWAEKTPIYIKMR